MYYYLILIIIIIILVIVVVLVSHQTVEIPVLASDVSLSTDTETLKETAMVPFKDIPISSRLHGSNTIAMYNISVHKQENGYSGVVRGSSADGCSFLSAPPIFSYAYYVSLDNNGSVLGTKLLDLDYENMTGCNNMFSYNGCEDPKLFIYKGEQWVVANVLGTKEQAIACKNAMCIFKVNDSKQTFRLLNVPTGINKAQTQKNWSLFQYKDDLLCEYSIKPHVILKVDIHSGNTTEIYHSGDKGTDVTNYSSLRGGANSIRVLFNTQPYYLGIGHITSGYPADYKHFFYIFNSEPPFEVIEVSEPSKLDHEARIQFAAGLSEYSDNIYVSYSISDCYNRISMFSKSKIMSLFRTFDKS